MGSLIEHWSSSNAFTIIFISAAHPGLLEIKVIEIIQVTGRLYIKVHQSNIEVRTRNKRAEQIQTFTKEPYENKCWENLRRFLQNIQKYISSDQIPALQ